MQYSLTFEAIEVLGETPTVCFEVVPLNSKHEKRVNLIERIEQAQEISRTTVSSYSQEVAKGRWNERGQLLFGEKLWRLLASFARRLDYGGIPNREGLWSSKPLWRLDMNSILYGCPHPGPQPPAVYSEVVVHRYLA